MPKIHIPTTGAGDWRALLADPEKQWRAGYSAMAVARSWEEAQDLPNEFRAVLGDDAELLLAIPEHSVPLAGGSKGSQCDVFALVRIAHQTCALAVEAKVNEPFGPKIGEWMQEPTKGRVTRLTAICELLGVSYPPPDGLRYQLFHRSAAAIVQARRFQTNCAAMVVQSFSQEHRWYEDFSAFCDYLGLKAARGSPLVHILPEGRRLILGWVTGEARFLVVK